MTTYSIYDPATGLFTGRRVSLPADAPVDASYTPDGLLYKEGAFHPNEKMVDVVTGDIVDIIAPEPDPGDGVPAVFDEFSRTWLVPPTPLAKALTARSLRYPPLTDLADALYWREKGDETKMAAYVAAVDAVKAAFPLP